MTAKTLADLTESQLNKIKNMLDLHDRWVMVYDNLEKNKDASGIILVDTYNPNSSKWPTMMTPRFLDDIDQTALHIREVTTVEPDDERELEKGSYPGALRINLEVGYPPRISPKSNLLGNTGRIPDGY